MPKTQLLWPRVDDHVKASTNASTVRTMDADAEQGCYGGINRRTIFSQNISNKNSIVFL